MGILKPAALVEKALALRSNIEAAADASEQARRLAPALVDAFADAGFFRMCVPASLGGLEVDPLTLLWTIETVAAGDGAAGWCVMIGATTGVVSAYLEDDAAAAVYGQQPRLVTGGVFAPRGKAIAEGDGFRVSGRWPFASGCQHCGWLMGGCLVVDNGQPRLQANGQPDPVMMLFPSDAAVIHDTWHVAGLCGTGSHDIEVQDHWVPRAHAVSLVTGTPRRGGGLYRFPVFGLLALGIAAVGLGIARTAIDDAVRLAQHKQPGGSRRSLAERGATQIAIAQAEARWRSARAFLYETVEETWGEVDDGSPMSSQRRALLRLAATHATDSAAAVVDAMYTLGGGTSIYASSRLQRCLRDIHVATQHIMVAQPTYELSGRFLLGLDADVSQL